MPRRLNLPDSASVAHPDTAGKLFAPSAARNVGPLTDALRTILPSHGTILEIASGTGQHVTAYAAAFPDLLWQPSEVDPIRRASIAAHIAETSAENIAPPISLDATGPGWHAEVASFDAILLSNLLHLISTEEAETLIAEAAQSLAPNGRLAIYGPFKRGGVLVSDGDAAFDASLRDQDPEIGYKSDEEIAKIGALHGLSIGAQIEMPANNLILVWQKPA